MGKRECSQKFWDPNLTWSEIKRSPLRTLRWLFRRGTALWRGLPQVYIAGVKKGGTTSLFYYLLAHPQILPPFRKEVKFFLYMYTLGLKWYQANFPFQKQLRTHLTLDATPNYLYDPFFAERVNLVNPQAKFIVLLRDPVRRALSHYFQNRQRKLEPLPLAEALRVEEKRLEADLTQHQQDPCHPLTAFHRFGYKAEGRYAEQLERLWRHIPREQTLVLRSEDLFTHPSTVLHQVAVFLGLSPLSWLSSFKAYKKGSYSPREVPSEILRELRIYFRPHNQRLYELLERDMGWEDEA